MEREMTPKILPGVVLVDEKMPLESIGIAFEEETVLLLGGAGDPEAEEQARRLTGTFREEMEHVARIFTGAGEEESPKVEVVRVPTYETVTLGDRVWSVCRPASPLPGEGKENGFAWMCDLSWITPYEEEDDRGLLLGILIGSSPEISRWLLPGGARP